MRRIGAWMMALLLCVVGTGCGRQLGSPISYEDFTGTYPVEGYVPSQEDLGRAPYSYAGAGPHFSVVLNVRQASEAERSVLIQGKWASAETMAQSGADFPERSEEYNALALKATEEAMALEEAEQIYLTELLVTHNGTEAEQFRYSVSDGGTLYLSGYAAGGEVWCRLANTPDGSYTEGAPAPLPSAVQHGDLLWGGTGRRLRLDLRSRRMKARRGHAAGAFPTAAYHAPGGA